MLRFPRLVPSPMCVPAQKVSWSACTLTTSAPRSASIFGGERAGHPQAEVEHGDALEGGAGPRHTARAGLAPSDGGRRLLEDGLGVRARARRGRARRPRGVPRTRARDRRSGCRPSSGSSTSTTQPSARNDGSASASATERTGATPICAASPAADHSSARNLRKRSASVGCRKMPVSRPSGSMPMRSGSSRYAVSSATAADGFALRGGEHPASGARSSGAPTGRRRTRRAPRSRGCRSATSSRAVPPGSRRAAS